MKNGHKQYVENISLPSNRKALLEISPERANFHDRILELPLLKSYD